MPRNIPNPGGQAEGYCCALPYTTTLAEGGLYNVHFWVPTEQHHPYLGLAVDRLQRYRDIANVTWSEGHPEGFWGCSDID